jgi:hypothetical protein
MPDTMPRSTETTRPSRQKALLLALAAVLMVAGLVVLFLLKRLPLPLRLAMGFVDFTAAAALLLFLRQKFPRR